MKRVLIAGGGVAALEAAVALTNLAAERIEIEVMAPERDFVYRPMAVAEPFGLGVARRFDLQMLAEGVGAHYRADALVSVDPERHRAMTRHGEELSYGALVIAIGARPRAAVTGATTFWGSGDAATMRPVLDDLVSGAAREVAFCVPGGTGWPLPVYELALMTASYVTAHAPSQPGLSIATPESSPLELFGPSASAAISALLEKRGVGLYCDCYPVEADSEGVRLVPGGHLRADRVVATPRLEGPFLGGVAHDEHGFVPTDSFGRVRGLEEDDVYAAGDVTTFPVKQGGIAAQQADAVAELLAADAGGSHDPQPFRPVLRGLLLTGASPNYLRAELAGGRGEGSGATSEPLWWPPGKIAGRYLAPHLATLANAELQPPPKRETEQMPIEVELAS